MRATLNFKTDSWRAEHWYSGSIRLCAASVDGLAWDQGVDVSGQFRFTLEVSTRKLARSTAIWLQDNEYGVDWGTSPTRVIRCLLPSAQRWLRRNIKFNKMCEAKIYVRFSLPKKKGR